MDVPRVVRGQDLRDAGQTTGMVRRTAFEEPGLWIGTARTLPGAVSGWHHHADNTTYIYCAAGAIRIESGPGGTDVAEARAGDFMIVPPNSVHRESNPSEVEARVLLIRLGGDPVLVNVNGPEPA